MRVKHRTGPGVQWVLDKQQLLGSLLLNSLKEQAFSSPPPISLPTLSPIWAWHMVWHMVEAPTDFAHRRCPAAGEKTQRGKVTDSRRQRMSKENERAGPDAQPGRPLCLPPQVWLPRGSLAAGKAMGPLGEIQQLGGTAGPGDPWKPSAGAESRSQSSWRLSCWS